MKMEIMEGLITPFASPRHPVPHCSQHDPAVRQQGREEAKMLAHDGKAVAQALAMALFGKAAHQVIGHDDASVYGCLALFQNTDTPVIIGAKIVRMVQGSQAATGHKRLMHDQHTTQIIMPLQAGGQAAGTQFAHCASGLPGLIYQQRLAI